MSSFNIFHFISVTVVNILDGLVLATFSGQASPCKNCLEIKKSLEKKRKKPSPPPGAPSPPQGAPPPAASAAAETVAEQQQKQQQK